MNTKQAMMLTALTAQQPSTDEPNESVAFVAFEAFIEKRTYKHETPFARLTYPVFINVHDVAGIQPHIEQHSDGGIISDNKMVIIKRSGGWHLVTIDEANKVIAHIRKLQGY
jgi:hypothetical protein